MKLGSLRGKSSAADIALSSEFVREAWGIVFHGASVALNDPEWKIEPDDAQELADRTIKLLKSLDKKTAAKVEERIAKYAPSLSLLMALAVIVGPRVSHTRAKRRAINIQKTRGSATGTGSENVASATAPSAPVASESSQDGIRQSASYAATSIRRENWREIPGFNEL